MADTYTLPVLTAANINGIVTAGQSGTYNIAYTHLTKKQTDDIGEAFEVAMQKNLDPVALSGDYTQLKNTPSASNLQGFHEVAFSGKASALDNGKGNNITFLTKTAFDNSVAGKIKQSDVNSWNAKSDFSGNYEDLNNLPNLNADAIDSSIFGLAPIATSGDYYDLKNIPVINLYLQTFSNTLLSDNENSILHTLGKENVYILNYDKFTNSKNISLKESLDDMISKNLYENYKCYIISESYNFLITNIQLVFNHDNEIIYYILDTIPYHTNNYDEIRYSSNDFSNIIAQQQLDDINIINKDVILIIDREYNVLYCKIKNV